MVIDSADREVYRLIEQRQEAALGAASDTHIGPEDGRVTRTESMFSCVPHPVSSELPETYATNQARSAVTAAEDNRQTGRPDSGDGEASVDSGEPTDKTSIPTEETVTGSTVTEQTEDSGLAQTESIFSEDKASEVTVVGLSSALAYANRNARTLQEAKEDIYLAALDLTLERHLWTPQFVASVRGEFADYGQVRDFDRAMSAVSEVAVSQRLPYGGEVTASVVNSLMRDLGRHVTSGETGSFILSADIPLFRGFGRTARESRYSAERELIYAVRIYERFRRSFLVDIAADYFGLQQSKAAITNSFKSYDSRYYNWKRAATFKSLHQEHNILDAPRAQSSFLDAEAALVSAKEHYASSLDRFKIRIGMPIDALLDVVDQDQDAESAAIEMLLVDVDESEALDIALQSRLDLLNSLDSVDDARRGVLVAKNSILPDLDLSGSVTMDTDANRPNSTSYNTERTTWRGGLQLRVDDRKTERNNYRRSLISLRRVERRYGELIDSVRSDVRRALRRIAQQENLWQIRALDVHINELRHAAAEERFRQGRITNRDYVEAEDDLLSARNAESGAIASYRQAILEFRRDTGTLRVDENGKWAADFHMDQKTNTVSDHE